MSKPNTTKPNTINQPTRNSPPDPRTGKENKPVDPAGSGRQRRPLEHAPQPEPATHKDSFPGEEKK